MNKKTFETIRKIMDEKKKSGEILPNRGLIEPANEVEFIKKKLCEVFIDYCTSQKGVSTIAQIAEKIEISEKELNQILHYHFTSFSLDFMVVALSKLAKIDPNATKVLHRMALSV